jgi:hypothetical protein
MSEPTGPMQMPFAGPSVADINGNVSYRKGPW